MAQGSPVGQVVYFLKHHVLLRMLRLLVISIPVLALLVLLAALYLGFVGFPSQLTDSWLSKLEKQGVRVSMDKITLNVMKGFTADGFSFYYDTDHTIPLIQADRVELDLDPLQWIRGRAELEALHVTNAVFRIFPEMDPMMAGSKEPLTLDQASASLRFTEPGWLHLNRFKARCANVKLLGKGSIVLPPPGSGSGKITGRDRSGRVQAALKTRPPWFTEFMTQLNALHFDESPVLEVRFLVDPQDWESSKIRVEGTGKGSRIRGIDVDGWRFKAETVANRLRVEDAVGTVGSGSFRMSGTWNFTDQVVDATVHSSLPPTHWLSLIPIEWRDRLREEGLYLDGPIEVNAVLGPAPRDEVLSNMRGTLHLQKAKAKEVVVQEASFAFDVTEDEIALEQIEATLGEEREQGSFQGNFLLERSSKRYRGHLTSRLDYRALIPVLSNNMTKLVREASFPEALSVADVDFAGQVGDKTRFWLDGSIAATNFMWRGTRVETFTSDVLVTNRTTTLRDFKAARSEGSAQGTLRMDFLDRRVDVDVVSTADPLAVGRAAGPTVENILKRFRFEGPTTSTVHGVVHVGTNGVTDLHIAAGGQNIGFSWIVADQLDFDLQLTGKTLAVTNATGVLFGGDAEGTFTCFPAVDDKGLAYELTLQLEQADFSNLVVTAKQVEGDPYRGNLSGQLALSGLMGPPAARTAVGSGTFKVVKGHLLEIPLFGGLSDALSALIPGLGFATETEVASDFTISNKVVSLPNTKLGGSVLTLKASGDYHFDQRLDFDVGVQLLRDKTSVGKIVQIVTIPISKLLEFHLGGTLGEPVWRATFLSKDVSGSGDPNDEP